MCDERNGWRDVCGEVIGRAYGAGLRESVRHKWRAGWMWQFFLSSGYVPRVNVNIVGPELYTTHGVSLL